MPPPLKAGLEETGAVSSLLRADVDSVAAALGQHLRLRVGRPRQKEDAHQVRNVCTWYTENRATSEFCVREHTI